MVYPELRGSALPDISKELDLSLRHLQAELSRVDILIRRETRRWQMAGQDPGDAFRGLYISDEEVQALLSRPLATSWGQTVVLPAAEEQMFVQAYHNACQNAQSLVEHAHSVGVQPRLEQLAQTFGLDRFDIDVLLICLAPAMDLRYERLYGYLQDDVTRKRPSIHLVLTLLADPGPVRLLKLSHFAASAPLLRHRLVERVSEPGSSKAPLLSQTLSIDETVLRWLLGDYQPHTELGPSAWLIHPRHEPSDKLLGGEAFEELLQAPVDNPIIIFYGADQSSQEAAARLAADHLHRPLLAVDLSGLVSEELPATQAVILALRDAHLTGAVPFLKKWDLCLNDGAPPAELLAELCAFPGPIILSGRYAWQPRAIDRSRVLLWQDFPIPFYPQRRSIWRHYVGEDTGPEAIDIDSLAGQFLLTSGQVRDAVASARDAVARRGGALSNEDLFAAARAHSNPRLSALAHKITPRYQWENIVLPDDQLTLLHEIITTVRTRPLVLEEWGVGEKLVSSKGVTVLFAGPPGTGKTMAAEIIAAELHLDLYKIDLSTVVSKYIGETEKNLERIFSEAEASNAILFFDEADALFGKRSEVRDSHDRYANIEISYLLQRMEAYDGVTVLATNLRANLDEAFTRRLQFAVDFPFPDEAHRLRIWLALLPPNVPRDAHIDFPLLARRFKLAGGNIRNIIVSAAYLAAADGGRVTMAHMLHGTRRELQKMGRLVGDTDLEF